MRDKSRMSRQKLGADRFDDKRCGKFAGAGKQFSCRVSENVQWLQHLGWDGGGPSAKQEVSGQPRRVVVEDRRPNVQRGKTESDRVRVAGKKVGHSGAAQSRWE